METPGRSRVIVAGVVAVLATLVISVLFLLFLASNLDPFGAKDQREQVDDVVTASILSGIAALVIAVGLGGLAVVLRQRWCAVFAALTFGAWALGVAWFLRWNVSSDISEAEGQGVARFERVVRDRYRCSGRGCHHAPCDGSARRRTSPRMSRPEGPGAMRSGYQGAST